MKIIRLWNHENIISCVRQSAYLLMQKRRSFRCLMPFVSVMQPICALMTHSMPLRNAFSVFLFHYWIDCRLPQELFRHWELTSEGTSMAHSRRVWSVETKTHLLCFRRCRTSRPGESRTCLDSKVNLQGWLGVERPESTWQMEGVTPSAMWHACFTELWRLNHGKFRYNHGELRTSPKTVMIWETKIRRRNVHWGQCLTATERKPTLNHRK